MREYCTPTVHIVNLDNENLLTTASQISVSTDPITNGNQIAAKKKFYDWVYEEEEEEEY